MTGADVYEQRVLVLAPTGRDASTTAEFLRKSDLAATVCPDLSAIVEDLQQGVGVVLVAEEALFGQPLEHLAGWVERQPRWSDLQFIMLTSDREAPSISEWRQNLIERLRNVSLIERPAQPITLLSAIRAALRARQHQYDVRSDLHEREHAAQGLEQLVGERTRELEGANELMRSQMAERQRAEDALRQSQKMEAVGQLTGGIAHDFNNLLTGIVGSLDLMQTRMAQGRIESIERYVKAAMSSAHRAAALTQRLLAFARRQALDPKPVQINQLVASIEDLLRRTIGEAIVIEFVTAGGLWPTLCDPNQLENALLNVVINARDAMPEGGKVTIETANAHLDDAYAAAQREVTPGQYVALCITDTGNGMPPEVIEHVFEPFFTTKPMGQGTGLGLSQIYGFVKQSGGHIRIYSEVGTGTTVKLYLPRYWGAVDEENNAREGAEAHRSEAGETVLVIEDEPLVRALIIEVLEDLGYCALEAKDGPSGLKILDSKRRIDLLVTDVGLPGLNGRQVADVARERRADLKVLFITGYAANAAFGNGMLDPGMHMISKPFAVHALAQKIRHLIEQ